MGLTSVLSKVGAWVNRPGKKEPEGGLLDLKLRYNEFKHLLRANNDVLTIIAEIENRLTTSRVLGARFLTPRRETAAARVYKMIKHLDEISDGAYPGLWAAFERITREIASMVEKAHRPEDDLFILPLAAVNDTLVDLTGSKAANLAAVGRFGLPGREGFVVTATAYRRLLDTGGIREYINQELTFLEDPSFAGLAEVSARIRRKILDTAPAKDLIRAIESAADELAAMAGPGTRLSVRSSAIGEDAESSFAGQYKTVLNVPPDKVVSAYVEVAASLYEPQAMAYRRRLGYRDEEVEMAVLILVMLQPVSSGVMYTRDPRPGRGSEMLINSVFGLGRGLVDGEITPDVYRLTRKGSPRLIHQVAAEKKIWVVASGMGVRVEALPSDLARRPTLEAPQAEELARIGLKLEAGFGEPQDVEWSYVPAEGFVVLQSRPLCLVCSQPAQTGVAGDESALVYDGGESARPGVGAGPVHLVFQERDLAAFPEGGVLVVQKSSPVFGAAFDRAVAVVAEIGGVTGHMASLAREAGIPAIVGAHGVMDLLSPGQVITVDADACRIYRGRIESLLKSAGPGGPLHGVEDRHPPKDPVARLITPLTLKNPKSESFRPENCFTYHDIIRFVHEMSFREMFRLGDHLGRSGSSTARRFNHPLPFELWVIDLGGGLTDEKTSSPTLDEIASHPGRCFLEGLLDQRIQWNQPRPVSFRGILSVFTGSVFHPDSNGQEREIGDRAYAIVSSDYLNFNSRVGYHYAAIDSVCGPVLNDNYISFRFKGGAAAEDRRALRAGLIAEILSQQGFQVDRKGDAVTAFIKKFDQEATGRRLADLGRLTIFTRQMDMLTHDRKTADWLARAFLDGNYNLEADFVPSDPAGVGVFKGRAAQ